MTPAMPSEHPRNPRLLTIDALTDRIESGEIDTVVVAFTDMQGRLQGKRLHAPFFLEEALAHGTEGCNYLLSVDVDMNTVPGYEMSSWEKGYGDMVFELDLDTIRLLPHLPGSVMIQSDLTWLDGELVTQSPRSILKAQQARAAAGGFTAHAGTELGFIVFNDTYEEAWDARYTGLTPANQYNIDYSILGTTRIEPLLRDIRNTMYAAGLIVESAKGECNSCHIHLSLRGTDGSLVFWDDKKNARTPLYDHFIAGILATMREFTLLYAPNINSYKRFDEGSFTPTAVFWGLDNRTCSIRLVGHGNSARLENRLPGGDVNPYMAIAAMMAGGLYGVENELPLEDALVGNAYTSDKPTVPTTLRAARDLFASSSIARAAFGDDVVDHYVHAADTELAAFESAITDWELRRGFERF